MSAVVACDTRSRGPAFGARRGIGEALIRASPTEACSGHVAHQGEGNWATEQEVTNLVNDLGKHWTAIECPTSPYCSQLTTSSKPNAQRRFRKALQMPARLFVFSIQLLFAVQVPFWSGWVVESW